MKLGNLNIGGMSFGTTRIGGANFGSTPVFREGSGPQPTMIPYIRGGADGSYIDTGITPDNTTKVIVWARNFNPTCGTLLGSMIGGSNSAFALAAGGSGNSCRMAIYYGNAGAVFPSSGTQEMYLSSYHKYEIDGANLYVDDTLVATSTGTLSENNLNIHILGANSNGSHASMTLPADICACKIYKGGVLVRDYTPASSPSIGLYDAVSDTVFANSGNGSFTYGTFDENAYTPLEYISCSGAQYFDTGLKGGYALPLVFAFTPNGTTAVNSYPIGARTTSSSARCEVSLGNTTYVNGRLYFNYQSASNTVKSTSTNNYFTNKKIVFIKNNNVATAYVNHTQEGTVTGTSGSSFVTDYNLFMGAVNVAETPGGHFVGKLHYCGMGTNRNYVPAQVNNVAGMYDTYNDVFKPSISGTDFIAGPEL